MFDVDQQIQRLDHLYRQLTGRAPQISEGAPSIPPGVDAADYVQQNLRRLDGVLQRLAMDPNAAPKITVYENDEEWSVAVEVPGAKKSDIDVHLERDQLRISGKRDLSMQGSSRAVFSDSARPGAFERIIPVPTSVDSSSLQARLENGVLWVTCHKNGGQPQRGQRIEVA